MSLKKNYYSAWCSGRRQEDILTTNSENKKMHKYTINIIT